MSKKHNVAGLANELEASSFFPRKSDTPSDTSVDTNNDTHGDTYHRITDDAHVSSHTLPSTDEVDEMIFRFRKLPKIRANADMPVEWKEELDTYAHEHKIGKYHLVMYAVAKMLKKI